MNNFVKNILLLVVVVVLSYFTAGYFGMLYEFIISTGSTWIGSESSWNMIIGFPFGFIFLTIILFNILGGENRNKWIAWLLVLPIFFFMLGGIKHLLLPIILALITFGLAFVIRKVFKLA